MPDPYFSPNGDGVKDSLAFNVIAETSEAYTVAVKRNGVTVKSWNGLSGGQSLSWDGKQNGQVLGDGNYRIVAMTEKQKNRVRDALPPRTNSKCIIPYLLLGSVLKLIYVQPISPSIL